jgi:hypothetical protein
MRAHQPVTSIPVELTVKNCAFGRCFTGDAVPHEITFFAHICNRRTTEYSRVVWLPTARRVERRPVERHRPVTSCDDASFERRDVRVAKVEQFGQ